MQPHSKSLLVKCRDAVFNPTIRLKGEFPLGVGTMAKVYVIATLIYVVGSFLPIILFLAAMGVVLVNHPELEHWFVDRATGQPNMLTMVGMVATSFLSGFGLEMAYIARTFRKRGLSLRKELGLNLDSVNGSLWAVVWRALVAFGIIILLQNLYLMLPVPAPKGAAEELAPLLHGAGFMVFAFIAVIGAPFFEELVFRGFLMNVLRTTFRKEGWSRLTGGSERWADYLAILGSAIMFGLMHIIFQTSTEALLKSLPALPVYIMLGCVLGALYRRSGSLYAPMLCHCFNNLAATLLFFLSVT